MRDSKRLKDQFKNINQSPDIDLNIYDLHGRWRIGLNHNDMGRNVRLARNRSENTHLYVLRTRVPARQPWPICLACRPPCVLKVLTVTTSSKPTDLANPDPLIAGIFHAATSGDRSARLREWLQTGPGETQLQEVYRELSAKDKGVAKQLKEKIDDIKRSHGQEALASDWAHKAELILSATRLHVADALAWQRDAAKAGAPLSREPLAGLKIRLVEMVKGIEDLQHQVMVQREAAVLLAQRIEVLSTKPLSEAHFGRTGLHSDVGQWQAQALALTNNPLWASVDPKYPGQLDTAGKQMQAVWDGFSAALATADLALTDPQADLPPVPVWADEIRRQRGEVLAGTPAALPEGNVQAAEKPDKVEKVPKAKLDPAQRQALREQANQAITPLLEALEKQIIDGPGALLAETCAALRAGLNVHGKNLDTSLDERLHKALTAAGDDPGWQRWVADQVRQDLVKQAEGLLDANKAPTLGGRKMQDKLRQLRDSWKQMDQGGLPNHALWKRFDAACNDAYKTVMAWLEQMKKDSADQRAQRVALMDEVKAWTAANGQSEDWRAQLRALHQFSDRWRNAGHLSEKAFGEMQGQWKGLIKAAAARLEAAQKASIARRQALIQEAQELGSAPALRVDAIKALQQRWQSEAQSVPLDRKTEQKLWEVFRAPLDEAFQRKGTDRGTAAGPLSPHDQAVLDASKSLDAANASGDVAQIRTAMAVLDAALRGQASQAKAAPITPTQAPVAQPLASAEDGHTDAVAQVEPSETPTQAAAPAPRIVKPVVAVRGDDRPGQKRHEAPTGREGRRDARAPERSARPGADRGPGRGGERLNDRPVRADFREERGPRLGDVAFRAQREAMERAEMSLRKLAAQAHGETLTRLMSAWQDRRADALPSAQELGKAVPATARQAWVQAVSAQAKAAANSALLRLEMAAEVPTPADKLHERRALQLQLLTQRNQPGPKETWVQDVAQVLSGPHDEADARRLQNALKNLLRS